MKRQILVGIILAGCVLFFGTFPALAEGLKPFVLGADPQQADLEQVVAAVKQDQFLLDQDEAPLCDL